MKPQPYGPIPYRPITKAQKLTWPNGARVALIVVPNIEFFPLDHRIPAARSYVPDVSSWGRREYGNRVGVFRMMDIMKDLGVPGTVALNSMVCDYAPPVVERCLELGWELMGHAETNSQALTEYESREDEKACIKRTLDRIQKFSGKRPTGWLGPHRQESWQSLEFFAAEGITYTFDWDSDDQPVAIDAGNGKTIVSMPYGAGVSDLQAFQLQNATSATFEQMIRDAFDVLYSEASGGYGRVVGISLHPFIVGIPHRIRSLQRGLEYICSHAGVWPATGSEITAQFLSQTKKA